MLGCVYTYICSFVAYKCVCVCDAEQSAADVDFAVLKQACFCHRQGLDPLTRPATLKAVRPPLQCTQPGLRYAQGFKQTKGNVGPIQTFLRHALFPALSIIVSARAK